MTTPTTHNGAPMTPADLLTRLLTTPDDGVTYVDWLVLPAGLAADLRAWRDGAATPAPAATAKGCIGCKHNNAIGCEVIDARRPKRDAVSAWLAKWRKRGTLTPIPGAPECPGREEVERG